MKVLYTAMSVMRCGGLLIGFPAEFEFEFFDCAQEPISDRVSFWFRQPLLDKWDCLKFNFDWMFWGINIKTSFCTSIVLKA